MATMTKSWTDERLEKRFDAIDQRFDAVDQRFDAIDRRFEQVDRRFEQVDADIRELRRDVNAGFVRIDDRFAAMQRTMIATTCSTMGTMVVGFAGILAAQL